MTGSFAKPLIITSAQDVRDLLANEKWSPQVPWVVPYASVVLLGLDYWLVVQQAAPVPLWCEVGSESGKIQRAIALGLKHLMATPPENVRAALEDIARQRGVMLRITQEML